jgi:hypothetical protein
MDWLITYTSDYDVTRQQLIITAATYTQAYLLFILRNDSIILDIKKI